MISGDGEGSEENIYGRRLVDRIPFFTDPLEDFVVDALEHGNEDFQLSVRETYAGVCEKDSSEGSWVEGMYDKATVSEWTVEVESGSIVYEKDGRTVPECNEGDYRKILERVGERIDHIADTDISYEIKDIDQK